MTSPASRATGRLPSAAVPALEAHQRRVGAGRAAEQGAARLAEPDVEVVVTGQQPGLLGGPLLALHKAAGAIARARERARSTGRVVVPVFWVASEDHDVAEIDRAVVIDRAGQPRRLSLGLPADRRSVADVALDPAAIARCLAELAEALPSTERGAVAVECARPPAGADVGSWFASVLARVLGDTGLVFVEPGHLAPHVGEVFARLVDSAAAIEHAIAAEGEARRAAGRPAPLAREPGTLPIFVRAGPGGARERALNDRAGLRELVRAHPELVSGDVVGRVFVQNAVLPVVEIVAGPTEAAYLGQIAAGARAIDAPFPAILARPAAIWLDAKSVDALGAFGLDARDVAQGRAAPAAAPVPPDPLVTGLEDLARRAGELEARALAVRGPDGATASAARDLVAVRAELERALRRRRDELETAAGRGRARLSRLTSLLRPLGEPQERVLCAVSLIARHGLEPLREALLRLEVPAGPASDPVVVTLD